MHEHRIPDAALLSDELEFASSRSSGPGGQNVNKVNTKVTLRFDIAQSRQLTDEEKTLLYKKLATKLTTAQVLILTSQDKRSQLQNKEAVIEKFDMVLRKAFEKKKKRKPTKPTKASVQRKVKAKQQHAEKKKWRQKLD